LRASGLFGRNLAWIRDPYAENFLNGISEELSTTEKLAEWTRQYASSLPHVREVHSIGYSSGSYGALMFGHLCRMHSVWAFSPRCAHPGGAQEAKMRLKQLLSNYNGITRYHIWYSALNQRDKQFADLLRDCPGVTLHPYRETGSDHYLIRYLAEKGVLRAILPPFLAVDSSRPQETPAESFGRLDG
jgi:hypothetical protein